ncbi:MAG: YigZ family protein [Pseudomonadota bacterium]
MQIFDNIISDRDSLYAVSGGPCTSPQDAEMFVDLLCENKKFAKATHHSWGLLSATGPMKNDDGEDGAGILIVRALQQANLHGHVVVVTRWFGGTLLGDARFQHVKNAVQHYLLHRDQ